MCVCVCEGGGDLELAVQLGNLGPHLLQPRLRRHTPLPHAMPHAHAASISLSIDVASVVTFSVALSPSLPLSRLSVSRRDSAPAPAPPPHHRPPPTRWCARVRAGPSNRYGGTAAPSLVLRGAAPRRHPTEAVARAWLNPSRLSVCFSEAVRPRGRARLKRRRETPPARPVSATTGGGLSKSHVRVACPSRMSESHVRVACPCRASAWRRCSSMPAGGGKSVSDPSQPSHVTVPCPSRYPEPQVPTRRRSPSRTPRALISLRAAHLLSAPLRSTPLLPSPLPTPPLPSLVSPLLPSLVSRLPSSCAPRPARAPAAAPHPAASAARCVLPPRASPPPSPAADCPDGTALSPANRYPPSMPSPGESVPPSMPSPGESVPPIHAGG